MLFFWPGIGQFGKSVLSRVPARLLIFIEMAVTTSIWYLIPTIPDGLQVEGVVSSQSEPAPSY